MGWKVLLLIGLLLFGIGLGVYYNQNIPDEIILVDCNKPIDVIYLTSDEVSLTSGILKSGTNKVVVVPELNRIVAETELLKCNNLNLNDYIDLEWLN